MAVTAALFGGLSLVIWSVLARRARRYRAAFQTPARRDDWVVCREAPDPHVVSLDDTGFDVPPAVAGRRKTVFLRLAVKPTLRGRWFDPFITITAEGVAYRQHFERGANGFRYLNLSPIFQAKGDRGKRIRLAGWGLRWRPGGSLVVFDSPEIPNDGLLVLAPHPDDAEIGAFGAYSTNRSWVVTITSGERGGADLSAAVPKGPAETAMRAKLRVWDSLSIPQLGGVPADRCLNFVYPDGQLRNMFQDPLRSRQIGCEPKLSRRALRSTNALPKYRAADSDCIWEGLVRDIRELLDETRPAAVFCPHPVLDAHPDHLFTTVALEQALRDAPWRDTVVVFLYTTFIREAGLYPFGPADSVTSLPPLTGADWIADSIYSHPLAPEAREAKYFAVEAAHDLRTYSRKGPPTASEVIRDTKRLVSNFLAGMGSDPLAFERRAPRPNEIYYVVSPHSLSLLVDRALKIDRTPSTEPRAREAPST
jgi:LmbE family N-acetylglucosaminyl deacetylase